MYIKLIVVLGTIINVIFADVAPIKDYEQYPPVPMRDGLYNGRITHGTNAATGQFPWQVFVEGRRTGVTSFCGGSLITSNAVLTAGHCCKDYNNFKIDLGSIYVNLPLYSQYVDSSRVVFHPQYNTDTMNYDAAIIKLNYDVQFGATVQPIKLPRISYAEKDFFADSTLTVSGWGRNENGDLATRLQYANLMIIKNDECEKYFSNSIVIESTICARDGRSSPCHGDSGGPAIVYQNNNWMLVGITSFVALNGNCEGSYPAGFVNVSFLLYWISSTTGIPIENLV